MPKVLVPIADGSEELEAVTIIDLLRRAQVQVTVASLDGKPITASRGVKILPDMGLDEALSGSYDMVVLPGGMPGAANLESDPRVIQLLRETADSGRFTCAICAAPRVLATAGVLEGKKATGYPGILENGGFPGVTCTGAPVERDGTVITSRGPGTAMDFALELISALCGAGTRETVEKALVRP